MPPTIFPTADVELVIDRSGSMSGSRINAAKNAAKMFVDFIDNRGDVSLFASQATVFFISNEREKTIKSWIDIGGKGDNRIGRFRKIF